jgi:hypothetical protein
VVAGGTDIGTIMAFVGGWFEFKSKYLNIIKIKMTGLTKKRNPIGNMLSFLDEVSIFLSIIFLDLYFPFSN